MPEKFKAIVIDNQNEKFSRKIEELDTNSLKDGNVLVKVDYSDLNYKDALILNNGGKIILTVPFIFPLVDRPHDFYRFTKYGIFYLLSDFNNVEVIERNSWTETISVLFVRHIMNKNLSSKFFALIFILTSILFYPFIYILGKLVNSDYICSGYSSSGIK